MVLSSAHPFPPPYPHPNPPQHLSYVLFCLNISCPFVFLHLAPAHPTSHLNLIIHFLFSLIVSIFSAWYFCHNSFTLLVLFPAHFSLWGRHPLQVALSSLDPRHFQPLMPSEYATLFFVNFFYHNVIFLVCTCFPQFLLEYCIHTHRNKCSYLIHTTAIPLSVGTIKCPYASFTLTVIINQPYRRLVQSTPPQTPS